LFSDIHTESNFNEKIANKFPELSEENKMSLFRIGANLQAMDSLRALYEINNDIGIRQARLASGKRINTAQDDTAGFAIAKSLQGRKNGLNAALSNVQNAKSILAIAEGGYQNQMDILQTIKDKAVQASDAALSSTQRASIDKQVFQLMSELDEIATQTKWSGTTLINAERSFSFHVGGDTGEELKVTLDDSNSSTYSLTGLATAAGGGNIGSSVDTADAAIDTIDTAIDSLAGYIQKVGDTMVRLSKKESFLTVGVANTDAVRSAYEDADFSVEQMELLKLQILQQTSVGALAQANTSPAVVLQLFGK
jgi:flagellin